MPGSPWRRATCLDRFVASPILFFLLPLYAFLNSLRSRPRTHSSENGALKVVCISDTHGLRLANARIPNGDLLIHCGDLTKLGTRDEVQMEVDWLKSLPHKHKVLVAGNHDGWLDREVREKVDAEQADILDTTLEYSSEDNGISWGDIHYLQNSTVTLDFENGRSAVIHGVPQVPALEPTRTIHAFEYFETPKSASPRPRPVEPATDILVSHSPPQFHLDNYPYALGCPHLLREDWLIRPALHVFGHTHASRGVERVYYDKAQVLMEQLCAKREECEVPRWERGQKSLLNWAGRLTWAHDFLNPLIWIDVLQILFLLLKAILWTRLWGGDARNGQGWLVNAACMKENKHLSEATVIEL